MTDLDLLRRHLLGLGKVLLGYSGGVDSALLAVVASEALGAGPVPRRDRAEPVLSRGPVAHRGGAGGAVRRAAARARHPRAGRSALSPQRHRPLLLLQVRAVDPPRTSSRAREGFDTVIDGTNADDLGEHRPGLARRAGDAASALRWRSWGGARRPCERASRELGLPTWDAPAAPCLSSRVRYGLEITPERLRQVEEGEAYLRSLGVRRRSPGAAPREPRERGGGAGRDGAAAVAAGTRSDRFFAGLGLRRAWSSIRGATGVAGCSRWRPKARA